MSNYKINIIIAQLHKIYVDRLVNSISIVDIPSGYEVEITIIKNINNKVTAYRDGTINSCARYNIYIDERVIINNKDFLREIIYTFENNLDVAAIGVIGSKIIPTDAKFRHTTRRIGEVEFSDAIFSNWIDGNNNTSEVIAMEEYVLATNQSTSWIDIGFHDDDFLFTTQCVELREKGYKCIINKKLGTYIKCSDNNNREYNKHDCKLFMDMFYKSVMPLVQVLIPTYNRPELLKIALESVINQTYKNIEIIISDNNDNNEATYNMLKTFLEKYKNIKYFHQKGKRFGINEQFVWLKNYDNPKTEYVSWLMDDDVYYPDKIATMIDYYLQYDGISIVTSARDFIDINGNKYEVNLLNKPICSTPTRFSGSQIGKEMLMGQFNFIGEPTTVLLKKTYLTKGNIGWNNVEGEYVIIDFPRWLELMSKGDLIYIPTVHSALRLHEVRDSNDSETKINVLLCWLLDIKYAWDNKIFITNEEEFEKTIIRWLKKVVSRIEKYSEDNYDTPRFKLLKRTFVKVSESLINGYKLELDL